MNRPVFIHIPRTGGNTLLPHLAERGARIVHHVEKDDLDQFKDEWVFSCVRDPCDRVISAYAYLRDGGLSEQDDKDANEYVRPFENLDDFILHGLEKASLVQRHFRHQKYWITDVDGNVVTNFLGRTERLQEAFDRVCSIFEWTTIQLEVKNASQRYGLTCSDADKKMILKIYEEDYHLINGI